MTSFKPLPHDGKYLPSGVWQGPKTAKRKIIYFLTDLRILTPLEAATIMVEFGLKDGPIWELVENIEYTLK